MNISTFNFTTTATVITKIPATVIINTTNCNRDS